MSKRQLTIRTTPEALVGEISVEDVRVFENKLEALEGKLRMRVFHIEVGGLTHAQALHQLKTVAERMKGSEPEGFEEDLVVPMRDGKPTVRVEFWEEVEETEEG